MSTERFHHSRKNLETQGDSLATAETIVVFDAQEPLTAFGARTFLVVSPKK
jgi:hypothetical protein